MNYYILIYDVVDDYVSRRSAYRADHLQLAQEANRKGELVLGGALADPVDKALLVFRAPDTSLVEQFVRNFTPPSDRVPDEMEPRRPVGVLAPTLDADSLGTATSTVVSPEGGQW